MRLLVRGYCSISCIKRAMPSEIENEIDSSTIIIIIVILKYFDNI